MSNPVSLLNPKKDAVDLKCKNRRLQQSVEDAEVFLSDLDYCSSDWKEAQAKLKQSLDHFNIEMISAFIYVFLLGKSFIRKMLRNKYCIMMLRYGELSFCYVIVTFYFKPDLRAEHQRN